MILAIVPRQFNAMINSEVASSVKESVYTFTAELTSHEKMLVMSALSNYVEDRLKYAEFMNNNSASAFYADAGRIHALALKLGRTSPNEAD